MELSDCRKRTTSIIEAVRKWGHFLYGKPFTLITDQQTLAFMFDKSCREKIKNAKIRAWRAELRMYTYHVQYRPGSENAAADALSRVCGAIGCPGDLSQLHQSLGHPGITRFLHFIRSKNLPFSMEEVRQTCVQCTTCSALKPRFHQPPRNKLIRATQAWERISIDFKGLLQLVAASDLVVNEVLRSSGIYENFDRRTFQGTFNDN